MSVCCHSDTVVSTDYSVVDELVVLWLKKVETSLYDVVTVEILNQIDHVTANRFFDQSNLFGCAHALNQLLNGASSVHVLGDIDEVVGHLINNSEPLCTVTKLQEFLTQIIAKGIYHELIDVLVYLLEYYLYDLGVLLLQLLLQESASSLVLRYDVHLSDDRLKAGVISFCVDGYGRDDVPAVSVVLW